MPLCNCARTAHSALPSTFGFFAAGGTVLRSPVRKISAMLNAVASLAKCFAVGHIKPQFRELGPRFNVMPMKATSLAAPHALEAITAKNGARPFTPLWHKPRAFVIKGLAAFPVRGKRADERLAGASNATEPRCLIATAKLLPAMLAIAWLRWISPRPARLAAILRRCCSIFVLFIRGTAYGACKLNSVAFHFFAFRPRGLGVEANFRSWDSVIEKLRPIRSPSNPCRQYRRTRDSSTPRATAASVVVYRFAILSSRVTFDYFAAVIAVPAEFCATTSAAITSQCRVEQLLRLIFADQAVELMTKGTNCRRLVITKVSNDCRQRRRREVACNGLNRCVDCHNRSPCMEIGWNASIVNGIGTIASGSLENNSAEISPAYCDVIVKRWETLTGKKAVLDTPANEAANEQEQKTKPAANPATSTTSTTSTTKTRATKKTTATATATTSTS